MPQHLVSWKEIARYVGKGVRTVQRWEHCWDFPVRRPGNRSKGTVLAFTDEIDSWMHSQFAPNGAGSEGEVERLRTEVERLAAENRKLRNRRA